MATFEFFSINTEAKGLIYRRHLQNCDRTLRSSELFYRSTDRLRKKIGKSQYFYEIDDRILHPHRHNTRSNPIDDQLEVKPLPTVRRELSEFEPGQKW